MICYQMWEVHTYLLFSSTLAQSSHIPVQTQAASRTNTLSSRIATLSPAHAHIRLRQHAHTHHFSHWQARRKIFPVTSTALPVRLGGPGSGKGTQSLKIAERYGFQYVSVGELLRKKMIHNATSNRKWSLIAKIITNGELAPQVKTNSKATEKQGEWRGSSHITATLEHPHLHRSWQVINLLMLKEGRTFNTRKKKKIKAVLKNY